MANGDSGLYVLYNLGDSYGLGLFRMAYTKAQDTAYLGSQSFSTWPSLCK